MDKTKFQLRLEIQKVLNKYECAIYTNFLIHQIHSDLLSVCLDLGYDKSHLDFEVSFNEDTRGLKITPLNIYTLYSFLNLNPEKIPVCDRDKQYFFDRDINYVFTFHSENKMWEINKITNVGVKGANNG